MNSYPIPEGQPRALRFPLKAVERAQQQESPGQSGQKEWLLNPSEMAMVAVQSAAPDVSVPVHHGADGADAVSHPRVRLTARNSRATQPQQPARGANPIQCSCCEAQALLHDAESAGSIPARLQNKPAAVARAQWPPPLQTFYVVSACPASIYACLAL
jgi:hypothetical protein